MMLPYTTLPAVRAGTDLTAAKVIPRRQGAPYATTSRASMRHCGRDECGSRRGPPIFLAGAMVFAVSVTDGRTVCGRNARDYVAAVHSTAIVCYWMRVRSLT